MGKYKHAFYPSILIVILICLSSFNPVEPLNKLDGEYVVIVNKNNPYSTLTKGQVKLYYLRKVRRRWPNLNKNIRPVERDGLPAVKKVFLDKIIGMGPDEVSRYFVERQYQRAESVPIKKNNDKEVIEYISQNVGAIGYVNKSAISGSDGTTLKIVFTF